jgi:chromate transporter
MSRRGWALAALIGAVLAVGPAFWSPKLSYLNLVLMKLSVLAFGGGFPLIPLIQHDIVDRLGWLTVNEFMDGVALGQVTPGPVLITATFVGYRIGGLAGAVTSTIAVFLPSFLVLVGVVPHFERLKRHRAVQTMIRGVLAGFVGLLLFVLYQFAQASLVDWRTWGLAACALVALRRRVDLLVLVAATVVVSIALLR